MLYSTFSKLYCVTRTWAKTIPQNHKLLYAMSTPCDKPWNGQGIQLCHTCSSRWYTKTFTPLLRIFYAGHASLGSVPDTGPRPVTQRSNQAHTRAQVVGACLPQNSAHHLPPELKHTHLFSSLLEKLLHVLHGGVHKQGDYWPVPLLPSNGNPHLVVFLVKLVDTSHVPIILLHHLGLWHIHILLSCSWGASSYCHQPVTAYGRNGLQ